MLLAMRVENIGERLRGLGAVVDRYERGDPEFPEAAVAWLRGCEQLLLGLRLREGAELATLRGSITRAGETSAIEDPERMSRRGAARRARSVAAAGALERAGAILQQVAAEAEARLRHFESKLTEALTAAVLVGLVSFPPEETPRMLARPDLAAPRRAPGDPPDRRLPRRGAARPRPPVPARPRARPPRRARRSACSRRAPDAVLSRRARGARPRGTHRASRKSPRAADRSARRCCAAPRRPAASPARRARAARSPGSRASSGE
jgi:hypothetical protein